MATIVYDVGDTVILHATFSNEAGSPSDQDTVTLHIERPNGAVETKTMLDHPSVGVYEYADTAAARGRTHYRFVATTGGRTVTEQGYYLVRRQRAVP